MKDETTLADLIIATSVLFIVFTNIIIGVTMLPIIVEKTINEWVPLLVAIGILLQAVMTVCIGLHCVGIDSIFKRRNLNQGSKK